jgi:hypothetical protein
MLRITEVLKQDQAQTAKNWSGYFAQVQHALAQPSVSKKKLVEPEPSQTSLEAPAYDRPCDPAAPNCGSLTTDPNAWGWSKW